jgi:hypothetical protein
VPPTTTTRLADYTGKTMNLRRNAARFGNYSRAAEVLVRDERSAFFISLKAIPE